MRSRRRWGLNGYFFRAYTLFEILVTVAVVGVLGGIAGTALTKSVERSRVAKLESDVRTLNQAVDVYLASGGSLAGATTAQEVIDRLKTRMSADQARRHAGVVSESAVDLRLEAVVDVGSDGQELGSVVTKITVVEDPKTKTKTKEEKVSSQSGVEGVEGGKVTPRAFWNATSQKFEIVEAAQGGVLKFRLNEDLDPGEMELALETRKTTMLYSGESESWVWDYQDTKPPAGPAPTEVKTSIVATSGPSGTAPVSPLYPPLFSTPGGSYPAGDFDLSLELKNPNPAGSSEIYYQVNGGLQLKYTGPISVPADATVSAVSVASTSNYSTSGSRTNSYMQKADPLLAPSISVSNPYFGAETNTTVQVTITHPNDPTLGAPQIYYTLNGGPPTVYSGAFNVDRATYVATGLDISAWVQSADPSYTDSPVVDQRLKVQLLRPQISVEYTSNSANDMEVTVTEPNVSGLGQLLVKIVASGTDPSTVSYVPYSGPISASEATYPDGFNAMAYVAASNPARFIDSAVTTDGGVFFGLPLKERTIFVIDRSSSMNGTKFETVRQRLLDIVGKYSGNNYIALVQFDAGAQTVLGWTQMTASGKSQATSVINGLTTGSGTRYQLAFEEVESIIGGVVATGGKVPQEVVFLSDGSPNTGDQDEVVRDQTIADYEAAAGGSPYYPPLIAGQSDTEKAAWIRAQNIRAKIDIPVNTIAIDADSEEVDLLSSMAKENNGVGPGGFFSKVSF